MEYTGSHKLNENDTAAWLYVNDAVNDGRRLDIQQTQCIDLIESIPNWSNNQSEWIPGGKIRSKGGVTWGSVAFKEAGTYVLCLLLSLIHI